MVDALRAIIGAHPELELPALPEADEEVLDAITKLDKLLKRPLYDFKKNEWDDEWANLRADLVEIRTLLLRKRKKLSTRVDLSDVIRDRLVTFIGPMAKAALTLKGVSTDELCGHFKEFRVDTALKIMDAVEAAWIEAYVPL